MGKPLVRFCEGPGGNCDMDEILWHRRESRRQTEKTNLVPAVTGAPGLLEKDGRHSSYVTLRTSRYREFKTTMPRITECKLDANGRRRSKLSLRAGVDYRRSVKSAGCP